MKAFIRRLCAAMVATIVFASGVGYSQNPAGPTIRNLTAMGLVPIKSVYPGLILQIHGTGFGNQGSSYVGLCNPGGGSCFYTFAGLTVNSWDDQLIRISIPYPPTLPYGNYQVIVFIWDGKSGDPVSAKSNAYPLAVIPPPPRISSLAGGATHTGTNAYSANQGTEVTLFGTGFDDFTDCTSAGTIVFEQNSILALNSKNFRLVSNSSLTSHQQEVALGISASLAAGTYLVYMLDGRGRQSNFISINITAVPGAITDIESGPLINAIIPSTAYVHPNQTEVALAGGGFGSQQGYVQILTNVPLATSPNTVIQQPTITPSFWSNDTIKFITPNWVAPGTYPIVILAIPGSGICGGQSNVVSLTIRENRPVWGFADLHAHPVMNFAFGANTNGSGGLFWGESGGAWSNYGKMTSDKGYPIAYDHALASDLSACSPSDHDPGDWDFIRNGQRSGIMKKIDALESCGKNGCTVTNLHGSSGAPDFSQDFQWAPFQWWPAAQSIVHQQMHVSAIRRAYEGGLRMLFASVTDDEVLTALWNTGFHLGGNSIPVHDPNFDFNSAKRQLLAIQQLVNENSDWMRIVTSSAQARQAINSNMLAVVLSVEMNTLTADQILSLANDFGVRHVIPIHLINNSFGGCSVYSDLYNSESNWVNGAFYTVEPDPELTFQLGTPSILSNSGDTGFLGGIRPVPLVDPFLFQSLGYFQPGGQRNAFGLSTTAVTTDIEKLMNAHLLIDIAHMGKLAADQLLGFAYLNNYPLMDSHTDLRDDGSTPQDDVASNGQSVLTFHVTERSLPYSQAADIGLIGGMIGLGTSGLTNDPDPVGKWLKQYNIALSRIQEGSKAAPCCVALGTDMNGLSPQIAFDTQPTSYPVTIAAGTFPPASANIAPLPAQTRNGTSNYNFQFDGIANYGMLPDFIQAVGQRPNSAQAITALFHSAEDVIEMWEKVEAVQNIAYGPQ